ncbi:hypothetical protein [Streptomyces flavofungini]|uniref:Integral membrane protein n=1 Tax=Streptomyces flavofungini TaxID=68200 RepID=A0ABS0X1C6_9ACTN|nr:hypothetical protein [Streptomyces flavofungini]MBJ3806992.1 hypothetical protein [Streptomyces flavofungini]GHC59203.1 hypothetical protein GCM10010349_27760 [Streptomyces flavofungini]
MSNEPYDPYQQYPQQPQPQQYQGHPGQHPHQAQQQPYDPQYGQYPQEPVAQQGYPQGQGEWGYQEPYAQQQYATQQWEGQTWETQVSAPLPAVDVTETAYLPPQGYAEPPQAYRAQASASDHPGSYPDPGSYPEEPAAGAVPAPPRAPAPDSAAGYGPATVTGNPRVTDAQRARAEGRSPIIEPGMQPALLTAVLGLLLAGGAAVGQYGLLVPLVILQGVTAAGWFRLNGMWPARQGIALAFLGGVAADVALLATGEGNAPAAILGTLGVWVLLVLVLQLRSRAGADERMAGLMATLAASALAIIAAGHLAAVDDAAIVGGVAVAAAVLARALPLPTPVSVVVALLAAAGAGIAVGGATDFGSAGALLGLAAGVCAVIGHRVASYDYPSRFVHFTAGVALPLAAAAPAVYLLGRALG